MKKIIGVLVLLVVGFLLMGEELWDRNWRNPYFGFWKDSSTRLKDISNEATIQQLGKHLYGSLGGLFCSGTGSVRWGIMRNWFGDYRLLNEKFSRKTYEEIQTLNEDAVKAYMGILDIVSWPEATPGNITEVSLYKAYVLKAAVMLSQCTEVLLRCYTTYVRNGAHASNEALYNYSRTYTGLDIALSELEVSAGGMLGYAIYVLRGQPTAQRLEKVPELREVYGVLDRLIVMLKKWGLYKEYVECKAGGCEIDVSPDTGFFATRFPFAGY